MAFAVGSKGAPLAAGLLKNLLRAGAGATPSYSAALGPASSVAAAAARRLFSSTDGGAASSLVREDEDWKVMKEVEFSYDQHRHRPGPQLPFSSEVCQVWANKFYQKDFKVKVEMQELAPPEKVRMVVLVLWKQPQQIKLVVEVQSEWYSGIIEHSQDAQWHKLMQVQAELKDRMLTLNVRELIKGKELSMISTREFELPVSKAE